MPEVIAKQGMAMVVVGIPDLRALVVLIKRISITLYQGLGVEITLPTTHKISVTDVTCEKATIRRKRIHRESNERNEAFESAGSNRI
jgi:hypothetical protein